MSEIKFSTKNGRFLIEGARDFDEVGNNVAAKGFCLSIERSTDSWSGMGWFETAEAARDYAAS